MNQAIRTLSFLCLIFIILSAAYFPVLIHPYIHHDDVKFFLKTPTHIMIPDYYQNVFFGRPLGAMRLTAFSFFINQVSDLTIFRFIHLLFLVLSAWLLSLQLRNTYKNTACALIASLIIFTLPPFQILIAFVGTCATPIALFLSILSARAINKPFWSLVLLMISLLIYPAAAMFYWVVVAIEILGFKIESSDRSSKNLIRLFLVGFGALSLYMLFLIYTKPYFKDLTVQGYNPYIVNFDFFNKLNWFINAPLFNALNLWNIFPQKKIAYMVLLFILGAGVIRWLKLSNDIKDNKTSQKQFYGHFLLWLTFLSLFLLSFLPNLMSKFDFGPFRCLTALSSLVILTLLWAVNTWLIVLPSKIRNKVLLTILIIVLTNGIFWSNKNLYEYRVKPSMIEMQYLKDNLKNIDITQLSSIHIIRPDLYKIKHRYDEFGTPTTTFHHNIIAAVTCILREFNRHKLTIDELQYDFDNRLFKYTFKNTENIKQTYTIKITSSNENEFSEDLSSAQILINMPKLYSPGQPLDYLNNESP